jgi:rhamnosyltransferase
MATSSPNSAHRVVAVVSAFRPGEALVEHCAQLAPQVSRVIVVDDGSGDAAEPVLARLEAAGATVLRQRENAGIGAAMNRGFEAARGLDPAVEFVVTFDQDSQVPDGFVGALVDEYDRLAGGLRVGMVAPEFFSTTPQTRKDQGRDFLEAYAPIQSGLLMPLAAIDELGPQRADYFIDLIDTEYYLRARRAGFEAVCVPGLMLPHGFGHRLYVHAFGRRLKKRDGRPRMVSVSSPFRYYYRARNRIVLNRQYGRDPGMGALLRRDALHDLIPDYLVALYCARGKGALLSMMLSGFRDGRRGRMGRIAGTAARRAGRIRWRHPVPAPEPSDRP